MTWNTVLKVPPFYAFVWLFVFNGTFKKGKIKKDSSLP